MYFSLSLKTPFFSTLDFPADSLSQLLNYTFVYLVKKNTTCGHANNFICGSKSGHAYWLESEGEYMLSAAKQKPVYWFKNLFSLIHILIPK